MWWAAAVLAAIFLAALLIRAWAHRAEEQSIQFGLRVFDQRRRASCVVGINAIPLNILTRARHEIGGFYLVRKKNGVFALSRNAAKYEGKTELYRASDIQKMLSSEEES